MNIRPTPKSKPALNQFSNIGSVLTKYIYHWPLFVLGLILATAGAYTYLSVVSPAYEISATILVKDEKKSPQEKSALPELEQSSSPKNAESEIEILRSKKLVTRVVSELQLWTSYKTKEGLKTRDIYGVAPFKIVFLQKPALSNNKINIRIKDKKSFEMDGPSGKKQIYFFSKEVKNSVGSWMLKPTEFLDQFLGADIELDLNDPEMVSNNYLKTLDAHLLDKLAPTIGLFVVDEVPQRGKDFLNNLITAYNDAAADEEKRTTKSTIDFIDNRLASLTGELTTAEKQVAGYRSSQGLTDISSQANMYLESAQSNDVKLNDVNVQLNVINGIEHYVNSSSNNENAPATIGVSDPALNSLIEKLSTLQLKRSALLATTPEGNPMFDPINKQIALTKAAIKENVKGIKSSLLNSKRELQSVGNKTESSIKDIPVQERQFVGMKRQQTIKENLYVYLLQKREELALSYASTFSDARIVDQANVGDIKWPKVQFIAAIALLCGLGIPFLIIYFRDAFNNRITDRRDIEAVLDTPIIAELSYDDGNKVIVVNDKRHLTGEQFRALRTNLNYLHQNKKDINNLSDHSTNKLDTAATSKAGNNGKVTLFTSSISKEGKSFVSTNLGVSLAASGRKTVILEMDLRKPKITAIFDLPSNHPGISEFLSSKQGIDNIIQPSGIANLDIIGSGQIPSDPSELLEKETLAILVAKLKEGYDDVIIDTAPLHLVTDAMIIARLADVTLYVIRQGYTGKDELVFIKDVYETGKLPNMNIVFNGIKRSKYGYGYSYDQSYYTGSGTTAQKLSWKQFSSRF
jgi:tyrosine-protein kinase Etk/Wzc